jgi:hypothetical protein
LTYSEWSGYGYVGWTGYGNMPPWAYQPPEKHYESVPDLLGGIQQSVIGEMFNPLVLQRIDENPMLAAGSPTMSIQDLFDWMRAGVYGELGDKGLKAVSLERRNLQQRYERTLIGLAVSPAAGTPDDAKSLARAELARLVDGANSALRSSALDGVTRAHLQMLRARAQQVLAGKS